MNSTQNWNQNPNPFPPSSQIQNQHPNAPAQRRRLPSSMSPAPPNAGGDLFAANLTGALLALASSAFIGVSFIVKKKGLRRAGAAGSRAGERPLSVARFFFSLLISLQPWRTRRISFVSFDAMVSILGYIQTMLGPLWLPIRCSLLTNVCEIWVGDGITGVGGYGYLLEPLWWVGMITSKFLIPLASSFLVPYF